MIVCVDQDSEFAFRDLDILAYANGVTLDFPQPGRPADNAFIKAFNSKLCSECLSAYWFMGLDDTRSEMGDCRRHINEERHHSRIGQNVPIQLPNSGGVSSPSIAKKAEDSSLRWSREWGRAIVWWRMSIELNVPGEIVAIEHIHPLGH
jgi:putative transposase